MADIPENLITQEEKIAQAKELFGLGSRNYCMKQYSEAADDLSSCCALYSEVYGPSSDECGLPYLLYAKSLITLGTEENKLIVPGEDDGEEEDDDDEGEGEGEGEGEVEGEENENGENEDKENPEENDAVEAPIPEDEEMKDVEKSTTNGHADSSSDPEPKPSTSSGTGKEDIAEETEEDKAAAANLEVAWEVLELAVKIFESQGEKSYENLSEALSELAGISLENGHFEVAIIDYGKALAVFDRMKEPNKRIIAEIHYKIGLSHLMLNAFENSVQALKKAMATLDEEIENEKKKEQTDEVKATIEDLEETKQEISNKIVEVEETKQMSIEEVKRELSKIIVGPGEASTNGDGAGSSSSSSAPKLPSPSDVAQAKPKDISHLIKRKKPDTAAPEVEGSPAKKVAIDVDNTATT